MNPSLVCHYEVRLYLAHMMRTGEPGSSCPLSATSEDSSIPLLFEAILRVATGEQFPNLKKLQSELFSRLVLPTLRRSQEQHRSWFSLFLAKHRPALDADILPLVPITPQIWHHMLNHQGHLLPSEIIDEERSLGGRFDCQTSACSVHWHLSMIPSTRL